MLCLANSLIMCHYVSESHFLLVATRCIAGIGVHTSDQNEWNTLAHTASKATELTHRFSIGKLQFIGPYCCQFQCCNTYCSKLLKFIQICILFVHMIA